MQPDDNDIIYQAYGADLSPIFRSIYDFFTSAGSTDNGLLLQLLHYLDVAWTWWSVIAFILSLLFIIGIIYSYLRINEYGELVAKKLEREHHVWKEMHNGQTTNSRWLAVEQHVQSTRPNDWRLAIIEADILLGEALKQQGYAGTSIGEQLKSISSTQLTSVQDAWDAHLIRNRIAHEGGDYVLTQRSAQEAIVKYKRVFEELGLI